MQKATNMIQYRKDVLDGKPYGKDYTVPREGALDNKAYKSVSAIDFRIDMSKTKGKWRPW